MAGLHRQVFDLKIERPTGTQAIVQWTRVPDTSIYMITLNDPVLINAEWTFFCGAEKTLYELPVRLVCGHTYRVELRAQKDVGKAVYKTIRQASIKFRAGDV